MQRRKFGRGFKDEAVRRPGKSTHGHAGRGTGGRGVRRRVLGMQWFFPCQGLCPSICPSVLFTLLFVQVDNSVGRKNAGYSWGGRILALGSADKSFCHFSWLAFKSSGDL